jgi:hypothetical protein
LNRRPGEFLDRVAVLGKKSVHEHNRADLRRHDFSDAGNNEPAIGVAAEDYLAQPLPLQQIHDIGDMGGEIDTRR